jgi:myo-inositol-1(or 4)-monophosphatase
LPALEADLALLVVAAEEAGQLALSFFGKALKSWDKGGELGPVTEADLAVDALLHRRLMAARPGTGWLSEETVDNDDRQGHAEVFIVDPIDGTRAFVAGQPDWALSLALVRDGRPVAGVVHLPARDETYTATEAGPARLNGRDIRVSAASTPEGATVLTAKRNLRPELWPGGVPKVEARFRPSFARRLALVAEGRFDAMLTLAEAWEWDIAAGVLIAERAGARVTTAAGDAPRFNGARPLVPGLIVAPPALHSRLLSALAPREGAERD